MMSHCCSSKISYLFASRQFYNIKAQRNGTLSFSLITKDRTVTFTMVRDIRWNLIVSYCMMHLFLIIKKWFQTTTDIEMLDTYLNDYDAPNAYKLAKKVRFESKITVIKGAW